MKATGKVSVRSGERVQKVLANLGMGSRRQIEEWIAAGRVRVNGESAQLGQRIRPDRDQVTVDGRVVDLTRRQPRVYYLLHKPAGYTTSMADPHAQRLVAELVPPALGRLFPVGRLDRDTTGLLLLTNDGTLAHRLAHPRYGVEKVYEAWVEGVPGAGHLDRLRRGIAIGPEETGRADDAKVVRVEKAPAPDQPSRSLVRLVLHEGQKREIRRLLAAVGHPVISLTRVGYAGLRLENLAPGQGRLLTPAEVERLRQQTRHARPSADRRGARPRPERPAAGPRRYSPAAPADRRAPVAEHADNGRSRGSAARPGERKDAVSARRHPPVAMGHPEGGRRRPPRRSDGAEADRTVTGERPARGPVAGRPAGGLASPRKGGRQAGGRAVASKSSGRSGKRGGR